MDYHMSAARQFYRDGHHGCPVRRTRGPSPAAQRPARRAAPAGSVDAIRGTRVRSTPVSLAHPLPDPLTLYVADRVLLPARAPDIRLPAADPRPPASAVPRTGPAR